jgi:thiamine biosynthesis protein ThiI
MIIVRYGEIGLKGKLRKKFEDILIANIRKVIKIESYEDEVEIRREWGRIYVLSSDERIAERIARVFGVASTSVAFDTSTDIEDIARKAAEVGEKVLNATKSFAVRARRTGSHPYTSIDVARIAGDAIRERTNAKVELDNPDIEIGIEVRENRAFVYTSLYRGFGGLPVGTQERVLSLISDARSFLSTWYALRRGCDVDLLLPDDFVGIYDELLPWACYRDIGIHRCESSDLKEMFRNVFSLGYKAIFCPITANEVEAYIYLLRERKMTVFTPLLCFDEGAIKRKIDELKSVFR